MDQLFDQRPELRVLYEHELTSGQLLDLRPQLALAKTLAHHYAQIADLDDTDNRGGRVPPALLALRACQHAMDVADKLIALENKLGPITRDDLDCYLRGVVSAVRRFVAPDRQEDFLAHVSATVRERDERALGANRRDGDSRS